MRTYSFDHFMADKPEPTVANAGGARQTPPVEEAKGQVPPSEEGQLHYGRQHARTAELYRKHREEREHVRQQGGAGFQEEPRSAEAPSQKARAEPILHDKEDVEDHEAPKPDARGLENWRELAQQAVSSVLQAAKETARGRPLVGARKLAGDTVSGVLRVAREVSARTSRSSNARQKGGKKGPGKKRQP
ncbi:hypothetical protein [Vitiosangium sp. GDMCC 1.1324]|uniref:hypothetical protein n=1 Tax=Vitiosangium sp. (strain GDMCC 1.1324) TaxID=2138576 RepID=UPI000D393CB4|nr:hypothetical protein [Vitiosangium sp. GDMCC 1.1324]PTL83287.1 hypothetical protein DAT35_14965 [Vitiosangium sp. GDMCC 1.1324]